VEEDVLSPQTLCLRAFFPAAEATYGAEPRQAPMLAPLAYVSPVGARSPNPLTGVPVIADVGDEGLWSDPQIERPLFTDVAVRFGSNSVIGQYAVRSRPTLPVRWNLG